MPAWASDSGLASNWDETFILILTTAATQVNCMVGLGGGKGERHFARYVLSNCNLRSAGLPREVWADNIW